MMAVRLVAVRGLEDLKKAIKEGSREVRLGLPQLLQYSGGVILERYKDNLSGSVPSTSAHPLPVGIRTGRLLAGAQMEVEHDRVLVGNVTEYASYIELGTCRLTPRRPLIDACEKSLPAIEEASIDLVESAFSRRQRTGGGFDFWEEFRMITSLIRSFFR